MVRRKLSRRSRIVTEGGGKATTKKPKGAAFLESILEECLDCENDRTCRPGQADRQLVFGIKILLGSTSFLLGREGLLNGRHVHRMLS
jgi:hypothetical protein